MNFINKLLDGIIMLITAIFTAYISILTMIAVPIIFVIGGILTGINILIYKIYKSLMITDDAIIISQKEVEKSKTRNAELNKKEKSIIRETIKSTKNSSELEGYVPYYNYEDMTVKKLHEICKVRNIKGYSRLKKKELIKYIEENL